MHHGKQNTDLLYMWRCLDLARNGLGKVAPNPMVGAVIVYENRIVGEGWHRAYGGPHAEVNAFSSVDPADEKLLPQATLYVNLEPCHHFGKTPPCVQLILKKKLRRVVVACLDPNPLVAGKSIEEMRAAGISVEVGLLEPESRTLNAHFMTFHEQKRPYVLLKWAETADRFIAGANFKSVKISGEMASSLVHQWRSEYAAIMVGTNTALYDNPRLTARTAGTALQPIRIVLDRQGRIPKTHHIYDDQASTICFTERNEANNHIQLTFDDQLIENVLVELHKRGIQSVLVEGGSTLIDSFVRGGYWDEARIITSPDTLAAIVSRNSTAVAQKGIGVTAPSHPGQIESIRKIGKSVLKTGYDELLIYSPLNSKTSKQSLQ